MPILGILLGACAYGDGKSSNVSLRITTVSATRQSTIVRLPIGDFQSNYVSFACAAIIDNHTDGPLTVMSSFFSSFDGLHLMVMDTSGRKLARQSYLAHQSPYSLIAQPFTLPSGSAARELRFPIYDIPASTRTVSVRLEGTLPGSAYSGGLTSNIVNVKISK
jgi:hypothetical protein